MAVPCLSADMARWSAEGGAEHRLGLRPLRKGAVTAEHNRFLPGFGVDYEHLPADNLKHKRATAVDFALKVVAADSVRELIGAVDAGEEVLEHAAIDHRLAVYRVGGSFFYPTANNDLDDLARLVEEDREVTGFYAGQIDLEPVALNEARLRERARLAEHVGGG